MLRLFNRYKYLLLPLLPFLLAACNKKLDLTPKDQIADTLFWNTPEDFHLAANDFYYDLQAVPEYIDNTSDIAFGTSVGGGVISSTGADARAVSNGSYLATLTSPLWDSSYKRIRGTNYLLQKAQSSTLGTDIDRWVGEALFFRAYHYWNLVKTFGGVPKIETVLEVNSPELYTPRSSQAEIIDFILTDLDNAVDKVPPQSGLTGDELGRVTRGAVLALKARAALYMGTWAKYHGQGDANKYLDQAIDAADKAISSGEYALYNSRGADSYKYLFIQQGDDSKEVILALRYYTNRNWHNWTRELWFNATVPTKTMADMYLMTDGLPITQSALFQGYNTLTSEFQHRDPRMAMSFIMPGSNVFFEGGIMRPTFPGFTGTNATRTGYMQRKFLDETIDAATFRGQYDFKEFRYAEVLLVLAEALYEKNGTISDADLARTISQLRTRVNMPPLTNAFVTANGLNMLNEIRRERTVELAFEGFRRDDLRRWKTAETLMPMAVRGVKFQGTEYQQRYPDLKIGTDIQVDGNGFIIVEPASARSFLPKHYLDPVPLQQIQLSHATLDQNTGW
ncbi:RagB/SusD family nutrient uptake outer membrane protein [Chitinophaga agrisoli]|uniref:RagB/SusD family nutrient uptake outer membrane protein n=1 Tax=Chitinophaga agrisoli TaxID=2607653 RepID=A0A5B2VPV9_9BACT|nr:RagB/SusD family nutrient uptake outer membrane protein [Chitinophaga agrisoli]KAA2240754.1 RagB/SusD family nutrient uptake outer membrane protein [Chitinophaga agrisoli]